MSDLVESTSAPRGEVRPLAQLDRSLSGLGLEVELCVVGGAVFPIVFQRQPATRRPSALFGDLETLRQEVHRIGAATGLGAEWLDRAVRARLRGGRSGVECFDGATLRIFDPAPEYVLALRSARLAAGAPAEQEELLADVSYLARVLGLRSASDVLSAARPYLPDSLLSEALELALEALPGLRG